MDGILPGFLSLLAWAIFIGALALAALIGALLSFHWFRYAMNARLAMMTSLVYSLGCLAILAFLFGTTLGVSSSL